MAYIPSECTLQEYEEQVYSGSNNHRLYIKYGDTIIGDEANEYASPFASSLKWTRRLLDNGSKTFNLDCFVSQEIELVLNDYVIQDITQEIDIKIGTYIEKLNKWVYIPLGKYLIQDNPTTNENRTTYKLKDKSKLFDFKYNAEPLITSKGGKATLLEILDDICSQANVNYVGSRTFNGYNEQIGIYDNTINARIYVSYIAEQSGSIATIDRNGNLTFIKIKQSELTTREVSEDIVEGFTDGDNFIISKVVYESGIIKYEKGNDNNDTLYINSANPYVSNQTQVDNIYNIVNGLNINSFAISKIYGNPTFDPWDLIVLNYEGKTYKTFAQYIFTFNGVFTSKYETTIEHSAKKQNVSINSEATFRKYAKTTIDNIDAKVNIATGKVEQIEKEVTTTKETTGNNSLYIEDALESRVLEYGIDGKSEQETRSGKNLLKYPYYQTTRTQDGITFTDNGDGSITINGTCTANSYTLFYLTKDLWKYSTELLLLKAGTYTFKAIHSNSNIQIALNAYKSDGTNEFLSYNNQNVTKTFTEDVVLNIRVYIPAGVTINNVTIYPQIEKGSTATEFEQYGASPSPDFPSEIKSVEGIRNLFDSLKGTSTTKNGMTITCTENSIILNGTTTAITNFWFDNLNIPLKKGAISFLTNVNLSGKGAYVWKENSTNILQTNNSANITIESDKTITQFLIQINSGVTFNNQEFKILLAEGNVSTFVPYGSWLRVQTTGKNLLNLTNNTGSSNGVSYEVTNGNQISFSGTATTTYCDISPRFTTKTLPKGTYTFSVDKPINAQIVFYAYYNDTQYTYLRIGKNTTSITIDIPNDTIKFFVGLTGLTIGNTYSGAIKLQLESGSTATSYDLYKENISLIDMNKPNLFDKDKHINAYINGTQLTQLNDGYTYYIEVEPNTQYTFKRDTLGTNNRNLMALSDKFPEVGDTITPLTSSLTTNDYTFTTTENTKYVLLFINRYTTDTLGENIRLYKGENSTPYHELCSIGDIKDTLIVNPDGTTIIEKKIGKVILDGSENWVKSSSTAVDKFVENTTRTDLSVFDGTSSHFKYIQNSNNVSAFFLDKSANQLRGRIIINFSEYNTTTLQEFKNWLSENPVEVYYVLAEPYTIDLGQVDISLFENINHINLLDDIETDTRVKYLINNVMNGTYATKGELELTNEQFQTTITNEFNSLERQMTSITQTGGAIDLAIQSSKDYTDSKNESLDNRITNSENNYNDLNNKYNTLNGKITDMNFSFKTDGLTIGTSGSEINSKLDNKGLKIYNASTLIAIFNQNGSGFKKLIATESIQLQNLLIQKRVINTPKANNMEVISFFFNKSLIENLTDLESD